MQMLILMEEAEGNKGVHFINIRRKASTIWVLRCALYMKSMVEKSTRYGRHYVPAWDII